MSCLRTTKRTLVGNAFEPAAVELLLMAAMVHRVKIPRKKCVRPTTSQQVTLTEREQEMMARASLSRAIAIELLLLQFRHDAGFRVQRSGQRSRLSH